MSGIDVKMLSVEALLGANSHDQYLVPLYQREYAWGQTEIRQLIDDLWEAFSHSPSCNYHLGTLVVCRRFEYGNVNTFELIDGQQRLTTLSLLYRILKHDVSPVPPRKIRFDNRPVAENFLDAFFADVDVDAKDPATFRAAVDFIAGYRYVRDGESDARKTHSSGRWSQIDSLFDFQTDDGMSFRTFILTKVQLFRVEMPASTDVSAYFEVMNNRGKQLEYHELVKAQMIARLRDEELMSKHGVRDFNPEDLERRFDAFWTECSNMNGFLSARIHGCHKMEADGALSWVSVRLSKDDRVEQETRQDYESRSVIDDFPNFLMHVLRLYLKPASGTSGAEVKSVPLDDRQLYEKFVKQPVAVIDPYEFLDLLIRARLRFDNYVVKAEFADDAVKDWSLRRIVHESDHYYPRNTFTGDEGAMENLIKLESMLQVTFRTRRHKEWLYELLSAPKETFVDVKTLSEYLKDMIVRPRLRALFKLDEQKAVQTTDEIFCKGTETPHFLLNAIDYLLWYEDSNAKPNRLKEFVFAYRSSVEHHHPRQIFEGEDKDDPWSADQDLNDIGNLCLVYPNENSSLSNHAPREKVQRFADSGRSCPPKQQIMYAATLSDKDKLWTKTAMRDHSNHVRELVVEYVNNGKIQ